MISNTVHVERRRDSSTGRPRRARIAAGLLGGGLVAVGLKRRSIIGLGIAAVGSWILAGALAGDQSGSEFRRDGTPSRDREMPGSSEGSAVVEESITIGRPREELYESATDAETVTQVLRPAAVVSEEGDGLWVWTVELPLGREMALETELVEDGEGLRWESRGRVDVKGIVTFEPAPADRGTELAVRVDADLPGGALGAAVARKTGLLPETLASKALYRFKSLVETGEIPTLEANPSARGSGDLI